MGPTVDVQKPSSAHAPDLAPRLQQAIKAAKAVAERQVAAVREDALTETYKLSEAAESRLTANTHLQLSVDDSTGQVIGRIVDLESGDVVKQIPSDEMLKLIARTKELFGRLVNETV
jgi:flagellar protein FlaG